MYVNRYIYLCIHTCSFPNDGFTEFSAFLNRAGVVKPVEHSKQCFYRRLGQDVQMFQNLTATANLLF